MFPYPNLLPWPAGQHDDRAAFRLSALGNRAFGSLARQRRTTASRSLLRRRRASASEAITSVIDVPMFNREIEAQRREAAKLVALRATVIEKCKAVNLDDDHVGAA
jgi:hypothetical protein